MTTATTPRTLGTGLLMHPLRNVWRCYITDPDPSADIGERTLFVEACGYDEAKARTVAMLTMLFGNRPGQIDASECYYNVTSFQELAERSEAPSIALRLFESGWEGPRVIGWVPAPMIVTSAWPSVILSDIAAHLPTLPYLDGAFLPTSWKRLSRSASQRHADGRRHAGRVHRPLDALVSIFGKPDATLLDWTGPNWSLMWPDGLVARIHGKVRGQGAGIWTIVSDDLRAIGRVKCIVEDGRLTSTAVSAHQQCEQDSPAI